MTGPARRGPAVSTFVDRLLASDELREWWARHDVARFQTHRRVFDHPQAGRSIFDSEQLASVAAPEVRVIVHLPVPGDDSAERLVRIG